MNAEQADRMALERRAAFEAYRAWRERRPWRWLPTVGSGSDLLRYRLFRRFGRGFVSAFVPEWIRRFRAAVRHDRARRIRARLADPEDRTCQEITGEVVADWPQLRRAARCQDRIERYAEREARRRVAEAAQVNAEAPRPGSFPRDLLQGRAG